MRPTISDSFEAWNRCNLSDEQLDVVISSLMTTIATLREAGGGELMIGALHQMFSNAERMKEERNKELRKRNKELRK